MAAVDRSRLRIAVAGGLCAALIASAPPLSAQTVGTSPLVALHQALHLSSQQEVAWQAYSAQAAAPSAAQGRRQAAAQMFPRLSAPQRLDLIAAEMRQELADLEQQAQVLRTFYAVLSPEQKSIFDTQTLPPANSGQQGR